MPIDREREVCASNRRRHLGKILFDMEDRVLNLVRWAHAIQDLGTADGDVSAHGLFAIGNAMLTDAQLVEADWKRCLELSRDLREDGQ